jgi:hypothetical protein
VAAAFLAVGVLMWMFIDPNQSLEEEPSAAAAV